MQLHNLPAALADGLTGDAPHRGLMSVLLAVAYFQALLLLLHVLLIPKQVLCITSQAAVWLGSWDALGWDSAQL